jgi:hypothetical protein
MILVPSGGTVHFETSLDGVSFTPVTSRPAPFDVSLMRPHAFSGTETTTAPPGTKRLRGFNVTPAPPLDPEPACPAATLVDTFDGTELSNMWNNTYVLPCCSIAVSGGRLEPRVREQQQHALERREKRRA